MCIVTIFLIEILFFHTVYNNYGFPSCYNPPRFSSFLLPAQSIPFMSH